MSPFVFEGRPARVVFGSGSLSQLPQELAHHGMKKALVLTTPEQASLGHTVNVLLGDKGVGVHAGAVMHVPLASAQEAIRVARASGADGCVAVGGGSTTGLAKAIALESDLPIIAVPTTYAGSEMTPLYGITDGGVKKTGKDWRVMPRGVIYDPDLTLELPLAMSMTSGMNAVAHAAEALYAPNRNPIACLMAREGIRALLESLPRLHRNPKDLKARSDALYGAWLCGSVLGQMQMGVHHKLCHTLGGAFNLPHAELHTVMLPYALAYNLDTIPEALDAIGLILGVKEQVPMALQKYCAALDMPTRLQAIGMPADGLNRAADLAVQTPYPNPRPIEREPIRDLLQRAFEGRPPC